MNPKSERAVKKTTWVLAFVVVGASAGLVGWAMDRKETPIELVLVPPAIQALDGDGDTALEESIRNLEKKRMSRKIVKKVIPPPPPPPKPKAPPLEKLIRLSGVIDFGDGAPPEAIIETIQNRQTKSYKTGATLDPVPARIEEIGDGVVVSYDEKRWKLTYSGVEKLSNPQGKTP